MRPQTGASVLSSVSSFSVSTRGSGQSLTGSQLDALIQRRSQLQSQMAVVEQHLAALPPPQTAGSQSLGGMSSTSLAPQARAPTSVLDPLPARLPHGPVIPTPAREAPGQVRPPIPSRMAPLPSSHEQSLPAAMRDGRYAFWPKRLPAQRRITQPSRRPVPGPLVAKSG